MIELSLIGIGTGNPDHLTAQAVREMNNADLILLPRKDSAKSDLIDLRRAICGQVLTGPVPIVEFDMPVRDAGRDYTQAVDDWHEAIAAAWRAQITTHLPAGGRLALLVWGDPSLYDSTLRIAEKLKAGGLTMQVRVVPGITSIQLLTAAHAIPLNPLAGAVTITTGRRLRGQGWPEGTDTLVVMLDSGSAFEVLEPQGITIWWGAYLGMAHEVLERGVLAEAGPRIAQCRAELRARHGWIMDVYLMRKEQIDGN
ncbi:MULTISPECIES: precorrin-6A synthase (deacetylating) [unclassified Sphingobium]|jgi:precorrin-6A synthase|uniref:precorrin-6A synthase (deacetylating) n=1 Tax=unclassified Sphingobium TaxID=2611147 RepID=UPI0004519978|nr:MULTISPECIES: precorrin-6A synthase (deacetylating) [unclassified Sphingobium]EXS69038.1 precorrin 6A synthase [Sphingobium sp. Ant17]KFL48689.1 precorrin-6A synthase deacetylating [Sphingobium sp. ba1]MDT7531977.1 precorrin-6A synthase (deacetylating) [Sphingobium sp. SA2]PBN42571.1 precorrin-6A synthase (deacetylating) [Sphingobium sp. D43FB]